MTPEDQYFEKIFGLRTNPFKYVSAEDIQLTKVLDLFVMEERKGLACFSLSNSIIRGDYGTGKTMMLKAVQAFYDSKALVDITERGSTTVIPVFVNFAALSHLQDPEDLYKKAISHVYRQMLAVGKDIQSVIKSEGWFQKFKDWRERLTRRGIYAEEEHYSKLTADEVTKTVKNAFLAEGRVGNNFVSGLSSSQTEEEIKVKSTPDLAIQDLEDLYKRFFEPYCMKILLLIDEIGELDPAFFETKDKASASLFEKFINQFRTSEVFVYKVTTYPNSKSDILQASRFGPLVDLAYDIFDDHGFARFRALTYHMVNTYLKEALTTDHGPTPIGDFFYFIRTDTWGQYVGMKTRHEIPSSKTSGDALEQLILASQGIIRKFIVLAGHSLQEAARLFRTHKRTTAFVTKSVAMQSIAHYAADLYTQHTATDRELIDQIVFLCKQAQSFRFTCDQGAVLLAPLVHRSRQDNVIKLTDIAEQSRRLTYEFDYGFCILQKIPTHVNIHSDRAISDTRSYVDAKFMSKVATLSPDNLKASIPLKGKVSWFSPARSIGYIEHSVDADRLFFHTTNVLDLGSLRSPYEIRRGQPVTFKISRNHRGPCAGEIVFQK
ncbi:MAG: cold shock domain-containing protein [bacterium]